MIKACENMNKEESFDMIIDKAENYKTYLGISKRIDKALELMKTVSTDTPCGKYEVMGDELYYIVSEPQMRKKEEGKFEAHKKYIDLQYMLRGGEYMVYSPLDKLKLDEVRPESEDCTFYTGEGVAVKADAGSFYMVFPQDAHMPGCYEDKPTGVKKAIFKIKVD